MRGPGHCILTCCDDDSSPWLETLKAPIARTPDLVPGMCMHAPATLGAMAAARMHWLAHEVL